MRKAKERLQWTILTICLSHLVAEKLLDGMQSRVTDGMNASLKKNGFDSKIKRAVKAIKSDKASGKVDMVHPLSWIVDAMMHVWECGELYVMS